MIRKYYLTTLIRVMLGATGVMVLFSSILFIITLRFVSTDIPGIEIMSAIMDTVVLAVIVWRIRTPMLEISEEGIKVGIPFLFRQSYARWRDIEGMVEGETRYFGIREKNVKLMLKGESGTTKEMIVNLKMVEKADEIIAEIRKRVPEVHYDDIKHERVMQKAVKSEIRYKGWHLSESGIRKGKVHMEWGDIKSLEYPGFVISGYGPVMINYRDKGGSEQKAVIKSSTSEKYQDVIRYLIQHARDASVDPGLIRSLEYSYRDARADNFSLILFLLGLIAGIPVMTVMIYYSPTIATSNIYPLIMVPFAGVPMLATLVLLAGRFRGKYWSATLKIFWVSVKLTASTKEAGWHVMITSS